MVAAVCAAWIRFFGAFYFIATAQLLSLLYLTCDIYVSPVSRLSGSA